MLILWIKFFNGYQVHSEYSASSLAGHLGFLGAGYCLPSSLIFVYPSASFWSDAMVKQNYL